MRRRGWKEGKEERGESGVKADEMGQKKANVNNKPERANLRPDHVSACLDFGARHVRYMKGQIDGRTDR